MCCAVARRQLAGTSLFLISLHADARKSLLHAPLQSAQCIRSLLLTAAIVAGHVLAVAARKSPLFFPNVAARSRLRPDTGASHAGVGAWSPCSDFFAFAPRTPSPGRLVSRLDDDTCRVQIYHVTVQGLGSKRAILTFPHGGMYTDLVVTWSPDASQVALAYSSRFFYISETGVADGTEQCRYVSVSCWGYNINARWPGAWHPHGYAMFVSDPMCLSICCLQAGQAQVCHSVLDLGPFVKVP